MHSHGSKFQRYISVFKMNFPLNPLLQAPEASGVFFLVLSTDKQIPAFIVPPILCTLLHLAFFHLIPCLEVFYICIQHFFFLVVNNILH